MKKVIGATLASTVAAAVIIIAKTVAWLLTGSSSILASLADSMIDIASSLINFVAAHYALQPPDNEHRFGKGKAEDLAVLIQSAFCVISSFVIIGIAIKRIIVPEPIENNMIGISLISFSLIVTLALIIYQSHVIKHTSSKIVKVDRLHYVVDFLTNGAVIFALLFSHIWHNVFADQIIAIAIAAFMFVGAIRLLIEAFNNLMDHELNTVERKKLLEVILSHPDVKGIHDLKTRYSGSKAIIQYHLEMDGAISLYRAHDIVYEVEERVRKLFKEVEIITHQDPYGIEEKRTFNE